MSCCSETPTVLQGNNTIKLMLAIQLTAILSLLLFHGLRTTSSQDSTQPKSRLTFACERSWPPYCMHVQCWRCVLQNCIKTRKKHEQYTCRGVLFIYLSGWYNLSKKNDNAQKNTQLLLWPSLAGNSICRKAFAALSPKIKKKYCIVIR